MHHQTSQERGEDFLVGPGDFAALIADIADGTHQHDMLRVHGVRSGELQRLAHELRQHPPSQIEKPPVLLIPGNMCTQLATPAGRTIWLNPSHLLFDWESLALPPSGPHLRPHDLLCLVKLYFMPLVLRLIQQGYRVYYLPYDWRADFVTQPLPVQNCVQELFQSHGKINIITHSAGGLVARGVLHALGDRAHDYVHRLILIASPNYGAWAMIRMFQGQFYRTFRYILPHYHDDIVELIDHQRVIRTPEYLVKRLLGDCNAEPARLLQGIRESIDHAVAAFCHPLLAETWKFKDRFFLSYLESYLTKTLICTWPAWYEMLPFLDKAPHLANLYDASQWPLHYPLPNQDLLDRALHVQTLLAKPPEPGTPGHGTWHVLMGTGVETLTEVRLANHTFYYDCTQHGDGLIPVNLATMDHTAHATFPGANHVELMVDDRVLHTICQILAET